ncbi:GNAT family N-acetyltransferase [Phycicoccus sp. BSK3Z-2]|uniref:GNAT family N-acetyltransferase n=1 Tax=Phycicoccus avicenniae TaxID=2828860 RepID=A0A941D4W6_9MICO|nr:GNAT family N-acetyltransferase [Phycicoccus avicenniae]MBR7742149.1 GNAT family N-acetyltransferase [Phycicoccus avicenniae]
MDVEVVADGAGLAALEEDWRRLDEADPRSELYTSFDGVRAWWAGFGAQEQWTLHVLVARHNGAVVGLLPLVRQARRTGGRTRQVLRFAAHGDYLGAVVDPAGPVGTVLKALLDHVDADPAWDVLRLDGIRAGSWLCSATLGSERWNRHLRHQVEQPCILLADVPDLATFEERGLPSKTRKYRNRLLRDHDVRFVVRDGDDGDVLARLAALHVREKEHLVQDEGRSERHSWGENPQRMGMYERMFATPGLVRTFCYESPAGDLLAARSTFRHGRTLLSWTSAYDPALRDYRLGKVIQYDVLEHVLAEGGVDVFDLGSGRYPWKFEWTEDFGSTYGLRVERRATEPAQQGEQVQAAPDAASAASDTTRPRHDLRSLARRARPLARRARPLVGRVVRAARSVRTTSSPPSPQGEVWYLARPGDELHALGGRLAATDPADLSLVHVAVGVPAGRRRALAREIGRPLEDREVEAAVRAELLDAAGAVGVDPDRVLLARKASRAAARAVVDTALDRHPGARHVVAVGAGPGGWLADHVVDAARRRGLEVEVVDPDPGHPGPTAREVVAAYRTWDPDGGRLALHRESASEFLVAVGEDPADPRARDL